MKKSVKLAVLLIVSVMILSVLPLSARAETYTITYDFNYDNKGTYKTDTVDSANATIIDDILNREGVIFDYVFSGWSTNSSAKPDSPGVLRPGDTINNLTGDMTLYAVWGENKWGTTLTAAGNGEKFTYDGDLHQIRGITDKPDPDRTSVKGENYSTGYFYQPLWYSLNVWRYTNFANIHAEGTDVGSYTTPLQSEVYAEIWVPGPWDNEWVLVEDTYTAVNPATMTIVAREVTIKIPDQSKKYDESGVTPDGELVNLATPTNKDPETASINAPTYTEAGVYPLADEADAISVKWDGTAKAKNYTVKKDLGTLTIYYEITFDANGGEDAPETLQVAATSTTMPSEKPTRSGYKFLGWAEDPDATTAKYKAGARTTLDNNLDLYAVWELDNPETDTNSNMSLLVMTVIFMVYVIEAVIYRRKRI